MCVLWRCVIGFVLGLFPFLFYTCSVSKVLAVLVVWSLPTQDLLVRKPIHLSFKVCGHLPFAPPVPWGEMSHTESSVLLLTLRLFCYLLGQVEISEAFLTVPLMSTWSMIHRHILMIFAFRTSPAHISHTPFSRCYFLASVFLFWTIREAWPCSALWGQISYFIRNICNTPFATLKWNS